MRPTAWMLTWAADFLLPGTIGTESRRARRRRSFSKGKVAFVSGASGGVGSGIARRLAEAHAAVAVHYRGSRDGAAAVVAAIAAAGGKAVAVQAELTEPAAAEAAVEFVTNELGPVDILVNNAARQTHARFEDMDLDEWRGMLSANLDGVFILTKLVAAQMIRRASGGAIVNIAKRRSNPGAAWRHPWVASLRSHALLRSRFDYFQRLVDR